MTFIEENDEIDKKIVNFHQNFKKKYSILQLILILKRQFFFLLYSTAFHDHPRQCTFNNEIKIREPSIADHR